MQRTLVLLLFIVAACSAGTRIYPDDPNIQFIGRFDFSDPKNVQFDWSGVQIAAVFQGTSLQVYLQDTQKNGDGQNMYNVFIDGVPTVLSVQYGQQLYTVAQGLSNTSHRLEITKRTEALFGIAVFGGFVLDDGSSLLPPPARPQRRIEFIGDSITCGYGDLGNSSCRKFTAETENNWVAYGPLTARSLDADYFLEAWSGMGLVRNYGDPNVTSQYPFPTKYPQTLACNANSPKWNFKNWVPDAVVINLGTNDYSTQPQPPQLIFETAYQRFINMLRSNYGNVAIFVVCGPMIGNPCCTYVTDIAKQNINNNVHFINMQGILSFPKDYGCNGHPNVSGHIKMMQVASPIIRSTLGW